MNEKELQSLGLGLGVDIMEDSAGNGWNSRKQKGHCSMEYWNGNSLSLSLSLSLYVVDGSRPI